MKLRELFATRLKERRIALRLSQEVVAESVGVGQTTVQRWEKGETWPSPEDIESLSEHLKISVPTLMDFGVDMPAVKEVTTEEAWEIVGKSLKQKKSIAPSPVLELLSTFKESEQDAVLKLLKAAIRNAGLNGVKSEKQGG